MTDFPKPIVVLSRCLELEACRYNGQVIPDGFVRKLGRHVQWVPVCPEVAVGLGVPREPVRRVSGKSGELLLQPATGRELSRHLRQFTEDFLASLKAVDGFILKGRSPSCGIKDVKLYPNSETDTPSGKGAGLFGAAVLEKYPGLAVEDEGRLRNARIRERFLTRLFALARFRRVKAARTPAALVAFQAENKLLLMAHHQAEARLLGKIAANMPRRPLPRVLEDYEAHLKKALARGPRTASHLNVLMHALGHFSKNLSKKEKAYFLDTLEAYRGGKVPLSAVRSVLRAWIARFESDYLARQTFFEPYPQELDDMWGPVR